MQETKAEHNIEKDEQSIIIIIKQKPTNNKHAPMNNKQMKTERTNKTQKQNKTQTHATSNSKSITRNN